MITSISANSRKYLTVLASLLLFGCITDGPKDSMGRTIQMTKEVKAYSPKFNAVRFLTGELRVEHRQIGGGAEHGLIENVFQNDRLVANLQFAASTAFTYDSIRRAKDQSKFDKYKMKTRNSADATKSIEIPHMIAYGYYARNDNCMSAIFTKRTKTASSEISDTSLPDAIVRISTCGISVSASEFVREFGLADASDARFLSK